MGGDKEEEGCREEDDEEGQEQLHHQMQMLSLMKILRRKMKELWKLLGLWVTLLVFVRFSCLTGGRDLIASSLSRIAEIDFRNLVIE